MMVSEQYIKRAERKAKAYDLLGEVCNECGTTDNLTVDHIKNDRNGGKLPSQFIISSNWNDLVIEFERCQLLCRSCHAYKTHKDRGHDDLPHGTDSMYNNHKCRCEACVEAHREYHKNYRKQLYAKGYKMYNGYIRK